MAYSSTSACIAVQCVTMRRAWPPVYRPLSQHKVVSAAAVPPPPTMRYRRDTVPSGACFVIAAPCSCSPPRQTSVGPLTVHNQQNLTVRHRGPPPPLPARNGAGGCPYRCCAIGRPQKLSPKAAIARPLLQQQQQQSHHQHMHPQQRRCAYVRPRPSRSLENLLRVVELDETAAVAGHRGVYEKSCHYGNPKRKMKVPGKENRLHAWKRRSMESLLSARDAATVAAKNFELFHHVRSGDLAFFY